MTDIHNTASIAYQLASDYDVLYIVGGAQTPGIGCQLGNTAGFGDGRRQSRALSRAAWVTVSAEHIENSRWYPSLSHPTGVPSITPLGRAGTKHLPGFASGSGHPRLPHVVTVARTLMHAIQCGVVINLH